MSVELFYSLSKPLQRRIDRAFEVTINPDASKRSAKKRAPVDTGGGFFLDDSIPIGGGGFILDGEETHASGSGGGFLVDDREGRSTPLGGGFLVEDEEETIKDSTHIPLSLVPAALQELDLPPDDDEILSVFRNAASGWSSATNNVRPDDVDEEFVSRDDWRSVCAVLLEHEDKRCAGDDQEDMEMQEESEDDGRSDEYNDDDAGDSSEEGAVNSSEDEYIEGATNRRRTRNAARRANFSPSPSRTSSKPKNLTARQQKACLEAFALFFPTASENELPKQKIMIKDIQSVASLLGEKLKAEDMIEMLEMFSSSPDKSMDLTDFGRMMVSAKLI
ncbi:hypothetical protein BDQ17DRAFT_1354393 [Cyathus striatus]|nr:hypothetical protein BDQ17DRAFT_1354393 [Cyathus striatus]